METIDTKLVIVEDGVSNTRLDKYLSERLPEFSRSRIQTLIQQGYITQQGKAITDASNKVKPGEKFHIVIPQAEPSHMVAQDIALDIIYEDEDLIVINKPAGLTVHPAPGNRDGTLVNALLAHCGDSLSGIGGVERPGIVHRIDKDTTGLLVVAKNDAAHNALSEQLATRTLKRTYRALCWGRPTPVNGTITGNIGRSISNRQKMAVVKKGGKPAATHYKTLQDMGIVSLMECNLETGRTHQIRVHFLHIGHPLVGDETYGASTESRLRANSMKQLRQPAKDTLLSFKRQALHAHRLAFIHPRTKLMLEFTAPLPDDMQKLIAALQEQ